MKRRNGSELGPVEDGVAGLDVDHEAADADGLHLAGLIVQLEVRGDKFRPPSVMRSVIRVTGVFVVPVGRVDANPSRAAVAKSVTLCVANVVPPAAW